MRWPVPLLLALASCCGCASYMQIYVNAWGRTATCGATGVGIVGAFAAHDATQTCGQQLRAAGFIELERAGAIGLSLAEEGDSLGVRVLGTIEGGPAERAGILAGEHLRGVKGVLVENREEAVHLLFGLAGESVEIEMLSAEGTSRPVTMVRDPFPAVYGIPGAGDQRRPEDGRAKTTTTWSEEDPYPAPD